MSEHNQDSSQFADWHPQSVESDQEVLTNEQLFDEARRVAAQLNLPESTEMAALRQQIDDQASSPETADAAQAIRLEYHLLVEAAVDAARDANPQKWDLAAAGELLKLGVARDINGALQDLSDFIPNCTDETYQAISEFLSKA